MYKCENCGHLFEEGEQARWTEEHGEKWDGCPLCRGDYEEVHQCQECGDWHTEDEIYDVWCEKCLRETINYDTFFEYCEANKDEQYLDTFVMCEILNCEYVPKISSDEFHDLMIQTFNKKVEEFTVYFAIRKMLGCKDEKQNDFLNTCIRFIMDDDGSIGRENYADWLNKRKGR